MKDKQPESEINNSLDFSVLPFDNAVSLLQKLGKSLLLDILREDSLKYPPDLFSMQDLQLLIRPRQFNWLNLSSVRRMLTNKASSVKQLIKKNWSGKLSFKEIFKQLAVLLKQAWSGFFKGLSWFLEDIFIRDLKFEGLLFQAMTGNLASGDIGYRLWRRIDLYFGGTSPNFLPDDFWYMVGQIAWQDICFRKTVAHTTRNYFRDRVIFTPDDKTVTILSPNTFWVLIVLAGKKPLHKKPWPVPVNRKIYMKAMKHVLSIAEFHVQKAEKWAGFWDQWIIWKALQHQPASIYNFNGQLRAAIADLPIFEYMGSACLYKNEAKENEQRLILADPTWRKEIPDWFDMYMKLCIKKYPGGEKNV
ncbi:MAG: hypothetical protein GY749_38505 [Desulfobacteraceae bacterium]|nr:hypothetical protein [Desulfobacteraceae bacterium]